jgi:heat-inducible transcriptional repressor
LVLDNGHVEHQVLEVPVPLSPEQVTELSEMLRQALRGLTVEQWRRTTSQTIRSEWDGQIHLLREILESVEDALTVEYERKLYLSGTLNMMNQPEFRDVGKLKSVLSLLEEQRVMAELMLKASEEDRQNISIRIGTENDYEGLAACSLVMATYQINGRVVGQVGLLGPTRMEYSRTTGLLDYMSRLLSSRLREK